MLLEYLTSQLQLQALDLDHQVGLLSLLESKVVTELFVETRIELNQSSTTLEAGVSGGLVSPLYTNPTTLMGDYLQDQSLGRVFLDIVSQLGLEGKSLFSGFLSD